MTPAPFPPAGSCADDLLCWAAPSGELHVRLYRGGHRRADALLVFFPPGGFLQADLDASDACLGRLAQACGITVLAPSYAVAPAHPFPAAVEDAHAMVHRAAQSAGRRLAWSGRDLHVGGIEAGGNLAAVCALMARDRRAPALASQILVMPMLDPSLTLCSRHAGADAAGRGMADGYRQYLPRAVDRVHPYACPLQDSRLGQLPPALVIRARDDALCDEASAYADRLEAEGVPVRRLMLPAGGRDARERCDAADADWVARAIADFIHGTQPQPGTVVHLGAAAGRPPGAGPGAHPKANREARPEADRTADLTRDPPSDLTSGSQP